ncbi:MAG: PIG-L family deacetylase [Gemmatimonas sp.]|nr:PIG-L family deacetylase [Gemmatimonas sp.]
MIELALGRDPDAPVRVLCLGAHSDDIEIGCGGTILRLLAERRNVEVLWVVFSGSTARQQEARCSAELFLRRAARTEVITHNFRDGFFPYQGAELKEAFEELKRRTSPDVIFSHHGQDMHQDHRLVAELTWNTFRDHLVLEYEIPKYDGDLTSPNMFVALDRPTCELKVSHLVEAFMSQREKRWFAERTFESLMRLRGIECASPTGFAEGYHTRKSLLRI